MLQKRKTTGGGVGGAQPTNRAYEAIKVVGDVGFEPTTPSFCNYSSFAFINIFSFST